MSKLREKAIIETKKAIDHWEIILKMPGIDREYYVKLIERNKERLKRLQETN